MVTAQRVLDVERIQPAWSPSQAAPGFLPGVRCPVLLLLLRPSAWGAGLLLFLGATQGWPRGHRRLGADSAHLVELPVHDPAVTALEVVEGPQKGSARVQLHLSDSQGP
eukprot:UN4533